MDARLLLITVGLLMLFCRFAQSAEAKADANTIMGLDIFGSMMGLVALGWDTTDSVKNTKKLNTVILKLLNVESKMMKPSLTVQYINVQENILITFDRRATLARASSSTIEKLENAFKNYYENHYGAAGEKLYRGLFSDTGKHGSHLFKNKATSVKICYNYHASMMLLLSKAAIVEFSYDNIERKGSTDQIIKKTVGTWRNRLLMFQDAKETLCATLSTCKLGNNTKKEDQKCVTHVEYGFLVVGTVIGSIIFAIFVIIGSCGTVRCFKPSSNEPNGTVYSESLTRSTKGNRSVLPKTSSFENAIYENNED